MPQMSISVVRRARLSSAIPLKPTPGLSGPPTYKKIRRRAAVIYGCNGTEHSNTVNWVSLRSARSEASSK